jgi:hypothetical protein
VGKTATVTEINVVREQVLVTLSESGTVLAVPAAGLVQEPRPRGEGGSGGRRRRSRSQGGPAR